MEILLNIEAKKFIKKKDVMLIIVLLIVLPFIMTIFFKYEVGGLTLGGQLTAVDYSIAVWSFLKMLFVLYIVPIYIPCIFIGREVEQRSINMIMSKEKREKILISKILMALFAVTVFTVLFFVVAFLSYKLLLTGTKYELVDAAAKVSVNTEIMRLVFQWLEMIVITLVAVLFNVVIKGNAALVLGFGVVALQKGLQNISGLKDYIPTAISDFNNMSMVATADLNAFYTKSLIVYGVYIVVLAVSAIHIWKSRDF